LRKAAEGSSQLSIRRPELEALETCVPSMATQKKIAQIAALAVRERDLLTSLIRNREQQLEVLATELANSAAPSKA
jgi:restriction endonuclease S subunit